MKKRHTSKYGAGQVTTAQLIAEIMCERKAKTTNVVLTHKFWHTEQWRKTFMYQLRLANQLLNLYSEDVVISAVMDQRCQRVYSLALKDVVFPLLEEYDTKLKIRPVERTDQNIDTTSAPQTFKQKTIRDKLR